MAVQDAVAAANRLIPPLRRGDVTDDDLAAVQADRIRAIERVQADQVRVERRAAAARARGRGTAPPALLKLLFAIPAVRTRGARSNAYGPFPPQLDESLLSP